MAVEAVACAVIQKVTAILTQDAIFFYKVIEQVEDIRLQLRELRGSLNEAEELETRDESVKGWVNRYLETIYDVEDIVESYALSLAHKKHGMGFLKNYGFFFHDLLACKKLREKLTNVEKNIQELNKKNSPNGIKNVIRNPGLSLRCTIPTGYNDLPPHYKLCLIYLGLFPKEIGIPVRRILRLWVAEGFLQRSNGLNEDFAQECLDYLVQMNLIKVTKFRSDGGPKVCLLHGDLHEHLSHMAQDINLFHIHQEASRPPKGARRIVEYTDITDYAPGSNSESDHVKNLRSYLSFNFPQHDAPAKQVGNFLTKMMGKKRFGLLRVLDLEGVYKPTLPNTLKNLLQLRYLGLRWTFLDILPDAVGDLTYLETLDLKGTCINNLPSSIWKLQHLRHLNLPEVWLDLHILHPSSELLTLWGLNIDDPRNLTKLFELRELGIICRYIKDFKTLMDWIASLSHLQSLSLKSVDDKCRPYDVCLQSLSDLVNLYHLKVLGKLNGLLKISEFPPNLRVLTLSLSFLTQDPMQTLSQLPCLVVLRLLAKSYTGQKMQCPQNGFHNLTSLKLWMLVDLQEWIVHKDGMPRVREVNIRHCHQLKNLPLELLKRPTLKELVLDNMLPEFVDFANKNKSNSTILKDNSYEFSPLPWEKDAELWD